MQKSAEFLSYVNDATGWINLTHLVGPAQASSMQNSIRNATLVSSETLVPSRYPEVVEGYKTVYGVIANKILNSSVAVIELLLGTNSPRVVSVQAAIQHPLRYKFRFDFWSLISRAHDDDSQGRVYINSSSVFDPPIIDPNYLSHKAGKQVQSQGWNRWSHDADV
jgi:choline dehydrogenase